MVNMIQIIARQMQKAFGSALDTYMGVDQDGNAEGWEGQYMTERELFIQMAPTIAEMVVITAGLIDEEYDEWLDEMRPIIPKLPIARSFMLKVLDAVDKYRKSVCA